MIPFSYFIQSPTYVVGLIVYLQRNYSNFESWQKKKKKLTYKRALSSVNHYIIVTIFIDYTICFVTGWPGPNKDIVLTGFLTEKSIKDQDPTLVKIEMETYIEIYNF